MPSASIAGNALTVVIAIMSFLACLTAGAVYMVNQSANAWVNDIASEITVELDPINTADIEKKMTLVALFLAKQKGITQVKPLTADDSAKLLEPWLGQTSAHCGAAHPAPDRGRDRPLQSARHRRSSRTALTAEFRRRHARRPPPLAGRDQDADPLSRARRPCRAGLVAAATIAVIVSATRSAMASNREIIEVLHFVGANERFISREFERHFLGLGVRAGLMGALAAASPSCCLPLMTHMLGGGIVTAAETERLIGTGELDLSGYFLCVLVVFVVACLCMITSRLGVIRVLKSYE